MTADPGDATTYTATFTADRRLRRHRLGDGDGARATPTRPATPAAAGTDTVAIDTHNPTVTVDIVDASLNDGDNSSRDLHLQRGAGRLHQRGRDAGGRHALDGDGRSG